MLLSHALYDDLEKINGTFNKNRRFFPYIRKSYLESRLEEGCIVDYRRTYIIYKQYQRTHSIGDVRAEKGDWVLNQILKYDEHGNARVALDNFLQLIKSPERYFCLSRTRTLKQSDFLKKMVSSRQEKLVGQQEKLVERCFAGNTPKNNFPVRMILISLRVW